MGETLIERRRVQEEGLRVVNCFSLGTSPALFGFLLLDNLDNKVRIGKDEINFTIAVTLLLEGDCDSCPTTGAHNYTSFNVHFITPFL